MSGNRYRQLFLFLVALILPAVVIAVLGWMLLRSERELGESYAREKQAKEIEAIASAVLGRLEGIRTSAQPNAVSAGPLVLVGRRRDDGTLLLPWEDSSGLHQFSFSALPSHLELMLAHAKRAEGERKFEEASTLYSKARDAAAKDADRAFAQQELARFL